MTGLLVKRTLDDSRVTRPAHAHSPAEFFRAYLTQLREEVGRRLLDRVFASCLSDGPPSKYWLAFASRGLANRAAAINC